MRGVSVWRGLLGLENTVVEGVSCDADGGVVVRVRAARALRDRCGLCRRRCSRYDRGDGRRRWRALDLGPVRAFLEADSPRVRCPEHGVVVAHVPWARHGAGHTLGFDQTVAWLATQTSKAAVTMLMRIAWRTVGSIISRVWADVEALGDRLDGLTRIGIDEILNERGYRYITVVVDHDTGRLVWACARSRPQRRAGLLRPTRAAPVCSDHSRLRRRRAVDLRCGQRAMPAGGAMCRPVPRGRLGDRGARPGPP